MNYKLRVFLLRLPRKILFKKKYRPQESNNIIFILPTDRPTLFFWLFACRPKNQLGFALKLTL